MPEDVSLVLGALGQIDAEYSEPDEEDPGELSGAQRTFSLDIVGHSAGINLFAEPEEMASWQEVSDGLGGVSVTFGTTAVSLNSEEGREDSLALAPRLAEALGGEAHTGVGVEETEQADGMEQLGEEPYVVECLPDPPGPATWSDGVVRFSQDCYDEGVANRGAYQCPGTDSYVDDPSQCGQWQGDASYANGDSCAAAICGYGYDAYGNPNPSSGEIQGRHMCQEGKIDDPEYCAAIEEVFANNVDWE